MSITTKRGDTGTTDLLYGKRVPKTHPRMEALGAVDELTSALGLARLQAHEAITLSILPRVQRELIAVMGLVAVSAEDYARYLKDGFANLGESQLEQLTNEAADLEQSLPPLTDWVLPGSKGSPAGAHLEMARAICRRSERAVLSLGDACPNPILPAYLNRLSDLLWLLARKEEMI